MFCHSLLLLLGVLGLGVLPQLLGHMVAVRASAPQQRYSRRLLLLLQPTRLHYKLLGADAVLLMGGSLLVVVVGHCLLHDLRQNMLCQSLLLLLLLPLQQGLGFLPQLLGRRLVVRAFAQQQCYSCRLLLLLLQPTRLHAALLGAIQLLLAMGARVIAPG
jgi:hypothetical protein